MNYFIDNPEFQNSKEKMKQNRDKLEVIEGYLNDKLSGVPYIWTINNYNDKKSEKINFTLNGTKLTPNQRGSNQYKHIQNAVFMASMRPGKDVLKHYEDIWGIYESEIIGEWTVEIMNQFIYRGAIRNYSSTDTMNVYVLDHDTAYNITGCNYNYIDLGFEKIVVKKPGRKQGSTTAPIVSKSLYDAFRSWKKYNKNKTDILELFIAWRAEQEKKDAYKGLEGIKVQLDYHQEQVK